MKRLLAFLSIGCFWSIIKSEETFAELFKPIRLKYLYQLVDAHPEMQAELDFLFQIKKAFNVKKSLHKKIIAYSLFWKAPYPGIAQPAITPDSMYDKNLHVKKCNSSFYDVFFEPLLKQLKTYKNYYPDWTARIYLAHDLEFLLPQLLTYDVEIFLMASSSLYAQPGALWRFLVFDDPTVYAAISWEADATICYADKILEWIEAPDTYGFFRLYTPRRTSKKLTQNYIRTWEARCNPIWAGHFGAKKVDWLTMEKAMKGFILHRKLFLDEARHKDDIPEPYHPYGFGNQFPAYGFDERFLKHVLYFEAADRDQLTLISVDTQEEIQEQAPLHPWVKADLDCTHYKICGAY